MSQPYRIADEIREIGKRAELAAADDMEARPCAGMCGHFLSMRRSAWSSVERMGMPPLFCEACCRKENERQAEAHRLAPIPTAFRWATFAAPELSARCPLPALESARAALLLPRVVLVGPSGTGKTSLGCAMVRDRLEARVDVCVALAWRLGLSRSKHPLGEDDPVDVKRAMTAALLLLDDMGSERNVASNAVPDVVFERHAEGRPTWVTTWMTPEKMAERYGDGIARRVFEGAKVIDCGGKA